MIYIKCWQVISYDLRVLMMKVMANVTENCWTVELLKGMLILKMTAVMFIHWCHQSNNPPPPCPPLLLLVDYSRGQWKWFLLSTENIWSRHALVSNYRPATCQVVLIHTRRPAQNGGVTLHCIQREPFTFLPFLAQLMVLSNRNQGWEERRPFKPLCVLPSWGLLKLLWSIMQWERERKGASALIQMTHKDTGTKDRRG